VANGEERKEEIEDAMEVVKGRDGDAWTALPSRLMSTVSFNHNGSDRSKYEF
jgi:hypothetical protein